MMKKTNPKNRKGLLSIFHHHKNNTRKKSSGARASPVNLVTAIQATKPSISALLIRECPSLSFSRKNTQKNSKTCKPMNGSM